MTDILLFVALVLLAGVLLLLWLLYRRSSRTEASVLVPRLDAFEKSLDRFDRSLREEIGKNRDELSKASRDNRQELAESFKVFGESVTQRVADAGHGQRAQLDALSERLQNLSSATGERLDGIRAEFAGGSKQLREEVVATLKGISESNTKAMGELGSGQAQRLEAFTQRFSDFAASSAERLDAFRADFASGAKQSREEAVAAQLALSESLSKTMAAMAAAQKAQLDSFSAQLSAFSETSGERLAAMRAELASGSKQLREEVVASLTKLSEAILKTMGELGNAQKEQLSSFAFASGERLDAARSESSANARQLREEVAVTIKALSDGVGKTVGDMAAAQKSQLDAFSQQISTFSKDSGAKLDGVRAENSTNAKQLREEVVSTLKALSETTTKSIGEMSAAQRSQLESFSGHVQAFAKESRDRLDAVRAESVTGAKLLREEVVSTLGKIAEGIQQTMKELAAAEKAQLDGFSNQVANLTKSSGERLDGMRSDTSQGAKQLREEVVQALKGITEATNRTMAELASRQQTQLETMTKAISTLAATNEAKLEAVRATVEAKLQSMQSDNAKQLDQMRQTVDEKLQGTLEKRLGESFKQVSERLELVHKGLGEMQVLATGVGDLKKVLTNVKTRGTWGEVQLGALLDQVLNAEQYAKNVPTKSAGERVEFAIKLPGQGADEQIWLPIDAKFPVEDYQRLIDAQERGDADGIDAAGKQLEARVKQCAADISEKYLSPPQTTDFGVLYLPIEGLFAEVIRRSALTETVQRQSRVVIAGPTTLWSILNSLQMGFRTLAIQKRSSEVWSVLGAVKTEWTKHGEVLEAVKTKLTQASKTIDMAQTRSRAIGRKLKEVQTLPAHETQAVLSLEPLIGASEADEEEPGSAPSKDREPSQ